MFQYCKIILFIDIVKVFYTIIFHVCNSNFKPKLFQMWILRMKIELSVACWVSHISSSEHISATRIASITNTFLLPQLYTFVMPPSENTVDNKTFSTCLRFEHNTGKEHLQIVTMRLVHHIVNSSLPHIAPCSSFVTTWNIHYNTVISMKTEWMLWV